MHYPNSPLWTLSRNGTILNGQTYKENDMELTLNSQDSANLRENAGYHKLSWLQRIGFGSGDLAQNLIYQTISMYLLFFYTNVYGLDPAVAAVMFLIVGGDGACHRQSSLMLELGGEVDERELPCRLQGRSRGISFDKGVGGRLWLGQ